MSNHNVGDLILGGFGLGMITKKDIVGDCQVEWYCKAAPSLRTRFQYHEISEMKDNLRSRYGYAQSSSR